ncbi:MAG: peptide chain release factor 1 [Candidatus Cloacimonetes bacterium]|jgi:peptide chain release factor 1|nr:peptide chain release factor 1 [Candidatus Cloacimonadota bacterium]
MLPQERINEVYKEYDLLKDRVSDVSEMNDQRNFSKITRRFNDLQNIITVYEKIKKNQTELDETRRIIHHEKDNDLVQMAKDELLILEENDKQLYETIKELLAPKDPNDEKNVIVEIRAGTGGDEAALFVSDLYRMYSRFSELKGWKKSIIYSNPTGIGGFKEIIFSLEGDNVFGTMRFESGVHRVQRIPETESNGRIHTSAISVAVLPEADDIDIEINDNDLKIDVYRSQGCGGQSVNTTDSAVRITHLPTGIVVTCQDEKSQIKNKAKAMNVLRSKLLDNEIAKQEAEISQSRKSQVGTGDRSAKIRTYNFPQSRITDHRINMTTYQLNSVLDGELDEFINALKIAYKNERLN